MHWDNNKKKQKKILLTSTFWTSVYYRNMLYWIELKSHPSHSESECLLGLSFLLIYPSSSTEEIKSCRLGLTHEGVCDDCVLIFGWTIPLIVPSHIKSLSTSHEHQTSQNTASTDAAGAVKTDLAPLYTHLLRIALPLCLNLSQEVFWWTHIQWNITFPSVHLVFAHRWTIITENYIKGKVV